MRERLKISCLLLFVPALVWVSGCGIEASEAKITWKEILEANNTMTEFQWESFVNGLKGKKISWTAYVAEVQKYKGFLGHGKGSIIAAMVMDPSSAVMPLDANLALGDVNFEVSESLAISLKKGEKVNFTGVIEGIKRITPAERKAREQGSALGIPPIPEEYSGVSVIIEDVMLNGKSALPAIRDIDFFNFTYNLDRTACGNMFQKELQTNQVKVKNGQFVKGGGNPGVDLTFEIGKEIIYGDLTGDGQDEAIVTTYCGYMHPTEQASIYTMEGSSPVLLVRLEEGGRAFGGIVRIEIKDGLIIAERMRGKAACCPEWIEKESFRWKNGRLAKVGKTERRKFTGP